MGRPDRHRAALVAAAASSLRRRGWSATSVADVLRASGAPNGSLYHHWPTGKTGLAEAALRASAARVDAGMRAAFAAAPDPAAALAKWIDALVGELEHDPRDGCPVATPAIELAALDHELRAVAAEIFDRWTATLAEHLDGDEVTARVVLGAIEGALLLDRVHGGTAHLAALRDAVGRLLPTRAGDPPGPLGTSAASRPDRPAT